MDKLRQGKETLILFITKNKKKTAAVITGAVILLTVGIFCGINSGKEQKGKRQEQTQTSVLIEDDFTQESSNKEDASTHSIQDEEEKTQEVQTNMASTEAPADEKQSKGTQIKGAQSKGTQPEQIQTPPVIIGVDNIKEPAVPSNPSNSQSSPASTGSSDEQHGTALSPGQNHADEHNPEPEEDKEEDTEAEADDSRIHIDFNHCNCPYPILTWTTYQGHEGFFTTTAKDNSGESLTMKVELTLKKKKRTPDVIYMGVYDDVGNVMFCY